MKNKKGQFKIQYRKLPSQLGRRGQFKIQQMAFMLVAVTIFFALAGVFYLVIYMQGVVKDSNEQRERRAIINAEIFSESPELSCGSYCVDTDRLMVLKNRSSYKDFWPYSSVEVRRVYPGGVGRECTFGNYPECDSYTLVDKKIKNDIRISNFVALCRKETINGKVYRKCELGKILLGVEVKSVGK